MAPKIILSILVIILVNTAQAQTDSLRNDSLYQKALKMTEELNSTKTNFVEKTKVPGFLVSNAENYTTNWSEFPTTNNTSANPNNAATPVDALILGALNGLYNIKKKK